MAIRKQHAVFSMIHCLQRGAIFQEGLVQSSLSLCSPTISGFSHPLLRQYPVSFLLLPAQYPPPYDCSFIRWKLFCRELSFHHQNLAASVHFQRMKEQSYGGGYCAGSNRNETG